MSIANFIPTIWEARWLAHLDKELVYGNLANRDYEGDIKAAGNIVKINQIGDIAAEIPEIALRLADAFWPGPLTMVLPKRDCIPMVTSGGLDTVAVRMPSHPAALALIREGGGYIAAPSANRSGRPSPTTAMHVLEDMDGRVPLILDGGPCEVGLESTVIDMTGEVPKVLRPGGITPRRIAELCGSAGVDDAVMRPLKEGEVARSPGMKYRHYAPTGALTIVQGEANAVADAIRRLYDQALSEGKRPLILALDGHLPAYEGRKALSLGDGAAGMARSIFARLREADALGADAIFSEAVAADGLGLAVMNRLGRAAAFHIIEV